MAQVRDIAGYEGLYVVSDDGEVYSLPHMVCNGNGYYMKKGKKLSQGKRAKFYPCVALFKDGELRTFSVHRLVAEAFIPNPDNLPEVNHKDENPENNHVDNLEWCSRQYNIEYSKAKRVAQYTKDGVKIAEYRSIRIAADQTGIGRTAINNVVAGWNKTAGGYVWKYVD